MEEENKKKIGIIAALGTVLGVLGFVFYNFFPKMKACCQGEAKECCGHKEKEKCCPPKKK